MATVAAVPLVPARRRHSPPAACRPQYPYQRNLWVALPRQDPEERMGQRRSFALTNIASLAGGWGVQATGQGAVARRAREAHAA